MINPFDEVPRPIVDVITADVVCGTDSLPGMVTEVVPVVEELAEGD